jgi:tetratricopeptide (TPR) repeat protein
MRASRKPGFGFAPIVITLFATLAISAQAPSTIQLFLPGGGLPGREIRFTLTRDDERVEVLFTDTKGKYQLTGDLAREREYTMVIEGDGRTFDTTTQRFRILRNITYVPIFLRPIKGEAPPPKEVVDVSVFDAKVPAEAKAAYDRAMKAIGDNDAETAIGEFTRALIVYPQYLRALNDLGVLYLKLNRLNEAAATFTQAISLNARFHFPRLNLGVVYTVRGNSATQPKSWISC